jgi:phosphomannomutase
MIKFGTDGWRGIIGFDFNYKNFKAVVSAAALRFSKKKKTVCVVAFDNRFLSKEFANSAAKVLCSLGVDVLLFDEVVPTPLLSFAIREQKADFGLMITASHNPYYYNGVKIRDRLGVPISDKETKLLEETANKVYEEGVPPVVPQVEGKMAFLKRAEYFKKYKKWVDEVLAVPTDELQKKYRVVFDFMNGAAADLAKFIFQQGEKYLRDKRDPYFSNTQPEPKEATVGTLLETLKEGKYDLGAAFDGDGDRLLLATPEGDVITPHEVLSTILIGLLKEKNDERKHLTVAKTISTTHMIDEICEWANSVGTVPKVKLHTTKIGFKYICEKWNRKDKEFLGGEESGGIGYFRHLPERDGLFALLLYLKFLSFLGEEPLEITSPEKLEYKNDSIGEIKQLRENIFKAFKRRYYKRKDVELVEAPQFEKVVSLLKQDLFNGEAEESREDGVKLVAGDRWLLLRKSGTENLYRLYAESTLSPEDAENLVERAHRILTGELLSKES